MAEAIKLPTYDLKVNGKLADPVASECGVWMHRAHVEPLLAELAELHERWRVRDAATEPPTEGEWVLGVRSFPRRRFVVRCINGAWIDEDNARRDITGWWPLPEVAV